MFLAASFACNCTIWFSKRPMGLIQNSGIEQCGQESLTNFWRELECVYLVFPSAQRSFFLATIPFVEFTFN